MEPPDIASVPQGSTVELVVIDVASCGSVEGLKQKYMELIPESGASVLVIVDTTDQEPAVLAWLAAGDEVCRRDAAARQLPFRIKRCLSRNAAGEKPPGQDPLTGLLNRQALKDYAAMFRASHAVDSSLCVMLIELDRFKEINDYLDRLLPREIEKCRRGEKPLSIALLDLDHFGQVNTAYGFPTGDRALKTGAAAIQRNLRAGDWLARYGGEEFCVVMLDTDLQTGFQIAERLRQALNSECITSYDGAQFQVSGSFGVVQMDSSDSDCVALFQRAGKKVREAKNNGRNQVRT